MNSRKSPAPVAPSPVTATPLLVWLRVLTLLAAVATFQALALPRWPRVNALNSARLTAQLQASGLELSALPPLPARRNYERATSPILRWRLGTGETLQLMAASVRQRDSFQTAFLIRDEPALALKDRLLNTPLPRSSTGRIGQQPALQTCLVPGVMAPTNQGVTVVQLGQAVDRLSAGRRATWQRLIGLRPNRDLSCILVSLQGGDGRRPETVTWTHLLLRLQTARFS